MKDIKKEFTEKFTYKAPADICEAYFNIPNSLWVCSQNAEEVWSWFESKLNEEREKSYLQGLKEGTDLAEERIQKEREDAIKGYVKWAWNNGLSGLVDDDSVEEYLSQTKGGKQ